MKLQISELEVRQAVREYLAKHYGITGITNDDFQPIMKTYEIEIVKGTVIN